MKYDEESVLTEYVWHNFNRFITQAERIVGKAIMGRLKAQASTNPVLKHRLNESRGKVGVPEVEEALKEGSQAFRVSVMKRVLAEHADEVYINRCPSCNRVVKTPKARQCLWCHYKWHRAKEA